MPRVKAHGVIVERADATFFYDAVDAITIWAVVRLAAVTALSHAFPPFSNPSGIAPIQIGGTLGGLASGYLPFNGIFVYPVAGVARGRDGAEHFVTMLTPFHPTVRPLLVAS